MNWASPSAPDTSSPDELASMPADQDPASQVPGTEPSVASEHV
ncbi:MAG: hypothetical protein Q8N13_20520 [Acidovorax sp.]|nr:hypothetical protein [Acidovorax sp.]